jgi:glutaredoxin
MANKIIVFTLFNCSHCKDLKRKLKNENIEFQEIEVELNQEIWDRVVDQTGHNILPTVYISLNGGDEGPVFVPERDYKSQEELIEKIKKYI